MEGPLIIEGYPGITQALTFSILKDGNRKNVTALARNIGIQPNAIDAARRALEHMVAYVEGRVYYNLTSWRRIFDLVPGCGNWLCPLFDTMIGAAQGLPADAVHAAQRLSVRHARTVYSGWLQAAHQIFLCQALRKALSE